MNNKIDCLTKYREIDHQKLYANLRKNLLEDKKAEDVVYALYCISEEIEKIYCKYIPQLIVDNINRTKADDLFEELKFSCNEIRQLIETSKLIGLKYWDDEE